MISITDLEVCEHVTTLRFLITANGAKQYRYQCVKCGNTVGKMAISYAQLTTEQKNSATPFDEELREQKSKERWSIYRSAQDAEKTERSVKWLEEHTEYLRSDEWRSKRLLVLQRDQHTCKANLDGCTHTAQQIHHLTYDHWRNEPLFDLISVCNHCHEVITEMDRARRTR